MKISGWLYLFLWVGYTMAMSEDFPVRMENSEFHMGWFQPVLPVADARAALPLHRRQTPMASMS
jgi:hypothetical protein